MRFHRELVEGERVMVYRNLNRNVWSVRDRAGHVIAHMDKVELNGVRWIVRPGGQAAVRKTGRKAFHAYALGLYCEFGRVKATKDFADPTITLESIGYNPYKDDFFRSKADGCYVHQGIAARFYDDGQVNCWLRNDCKAKPSVYPWRRQ
jgi:hypothetical protein